MSKKLFIGKTKPLIELCSNIIDCPHSTPNWIDTNTGKIVIRNFNIKKGRLDFTKTYYTDNVTFNDRIKRAKPKEGDIIITREAPMGEVCLIPKNLECCLGQRMVLIKPNTAVCDNKYLLYSLQSEYVQIQIQSNNNSGSIVSNMCIPDLEQLKIPYIPKLEQEKIGKTLALIDAKIELNNRINAELEAMAKTVYDYWFVQFDFPNEDGKPYRTEGGKMVWSDELKREIPEGWEVGSLSDIANITMGQSPPGESYNDEGEGMIFFQGCTDFGTRYPSIRLFTTQPTRFAKANDILLSVRAPVGTINIANVDCCIGRGLAALNSKNEANTFLFGVLMNLKQIFDRRNVDGTTFGSITKDDLYSLKVVIPDDDIVKAYQNMLNAAFEKQNKIDIENQHLTELRDWLLPMLMNGQVQVISSE